ncbi:putative dual-specificity RNA methyltransferase RlmN [Clostridium tepidiprofundi DSM 19306]|uniref:Probable dual-specificity RNA methyltransferase RlmN n=1 Tax=Clostridium tepidiprofundi DSM 19306 TaxID=1121338 RepID=A0A151B7P8_9CLOT|nr:23S rRNA (adenine(2503)-C(2))-methyltransferase RlmN [Clostridium tepidiprofundi]KYH35914.1 putative dual-specificity RNA methyltransferase RlmN [Clostridium tepidiprofundi DSM 19306]
MENILDYTLEELQIWMKENGESSFRAKQIFDWIYKNEWNFENMSNLSKKTIKNISENFYIGIPEIIREIKSDIDGTQKLLLALKDNNLIEAVVMKYKYGNSICISTQIGCRMGCKFCASTVGGMIRNLTAGEMLGEILRAQNKIGDRISNVVLMGTGEPLDNYDNVMKFLKIVNSKYGLNIGQRHITLSTCGIVPNIIKLADEKLQITLAISLHAPNDLIRKKTMPIANKYSINQIIDACKYYINKTNRRITFEYALINGLNDKNEHAKELSNLLKGLLCHVNLIPVNEVTESGFVRSTSESINNFRKILEYNGIETTVRREMGSDINAACGQLRRSYMKGSLK